MSSLWDGFWAGTVFGRTTLDAVDCSTVTLDNVYSQKICLRMKF